MLKASEVIVTIESMCVFSWIAFEKAPQLCGEYADPIEKTQRYNLPDTARSVVHVT